jgi:hypothetical protein
MFDLCLTKRRMFEELFIKRQFFSISRICDEKCSKPKIVLAFFSKLLCFSFIFVVLQLATFLITSGC